MLNSISLMYVNVVFICNVFVICPNGIIYSGYPFVFNVCSTTIVYMFAPFIHPHSSVVTTQFLYSVILKIYRSQYYIVYTYWYAAFSRQFLHFYNKYKRVFRAVLFYYYYYYYDTNYEALI